MGLAAATTAPHFSDHDAPHPELSNVSSDDAALSDFSNPAATDLDFSDLAPAHPCG